jgi:hypothetical protein
MTAVNLRRDVQFHLWAHQVAAGQQALAAVQSRLKNAVEQMQPQPLSKRDSIQMASMHSTELPTHTLDPQPSEQ